MRALSLLIAGSFSVLFLPGCPPPAPEAALSVSSTTHTFGVGEEEWTFQVWNSGEAGSTLTFVLAALQGFVEVTPTSGSSTGVDNKVDVTVTVDRPVFAKARVQGAIEITSNGGDSVVRVDFSEAVDKFALWTHGTQLRGANIVQRRVYPDLDGPTFLGPGPVGPPFVQADFDRLASLGANYVNFSLPGLFTETAPYVVDAGVQANLDALITMAANAGLFVVISARTGPGRSEFTFIRELAGSLFPEEYLDDSVWESQEKQDAWVAMWRYTADRYADRGHVVGYDLMVEPNANAVFFEEYDPEAFYAQYANTLYDWNQLHPEIAAAVREEDANTPILVGGMSFSAAPWLPYVALTGVARTVYTAHTYEPFIYTHQGPGFPRYTYPGTFNADGAPGNEMVNRAWLAEQFAPLEAFAAAHGVPVAVNEYGVHRYAPGAEVYMDDMMNLLEERGINHALWLFNSSWDEYVSVIDDFDFLHGQNAGNHTNTTSALRSTIEAYWGLNAVFPE